MKRLIAVVLLLALACLCGCGAAMPAESELPETAAPSALEPAPELAPILAEIRERMHPGTAGSSLTAAQLACSLLDWCVLTDWDEAQIRAAVEDYLQPLPKIERTEFALQMSSVCGAVDMLLSGEGDGLLDDIGGREGTLWPWDNAPREKLDAVFSAAGTDDVVIP